MLVEKCLSGICFIPMHQNGVRFFGFSEFLTALALMVIAWTTGDIRYRFRIRCAPIPLQIITFSIVSGTGILILLTDLWRAQGWLIPEQHWITGAVWQAMLGGVLLLTFLCWAWFAFIRPPIFGLFNARHYARALYRAILSGSPTELAIVADELAQSARSLIRFAPTTEQERKHVHEVKPKRWQLRTKAMAFADELLLLIADQRFCKAIVESSPIAALNLYTAVRGTKKYGVNIGVFSENLVSAAIENKNSFIYHEIAAYSSGLLGYHKPLTSTMFSNYQMVETVGTFFDSSFAAQDKWDAEQWEAYCRIVLMTTRDYVKEDVLSHSFALYRAKGRIERSLGDLYKLDKGPYPGWDSNMLSQLRVVVDFVQEVVKILDQQPLSPGLMLRTRNSDARQSGETFYDYIASMIFEIIHSAAYVTAPRDLCWTIQHNFVWSEIFDSLGPTGPASKMIKFKVRRQLYDAIARMNTFPNYKGARILAFCLNVLGITSAGKWPGAKDSRVLQIAVLSWTRKNFVWLYQTSPSVAEACLVEGFSYDPAGMKLVLSAPNVGLRRVADQEFTLCPPKSPRR